MLIDLVFIDLKFFREWLFPRTSEFMSFLFEFIWRQMRKNGRKYQGKMEGIFCRIFIEVKQFFVSRARLLTYLVYHTRKKIVNITDTLKRVIGILVNWHIPTAILMRIARPIVAKLTVGMCQFTRIPMTRIKVSVMLSNFFQCMIAWLGNFTHRESNPESG